MSVELIAIFGLGIMFVIATVLPVNMGALALAMAFIVGTTAVGMPSGDIMDGFPGGLFATLVGITYLFAIARNNGTIDYIVHASVQAVRGRIALMPWVMFGITGLLTAIGAVVPASVAIIAPIAMRFAVQYKINPLMMGLLVAHGAQAGSFSPISIFGGITNGVVARAELPTGPFTIFLASLLLNLGLALVLYVVMGGLALRGKRAADMEQAIDEEGNVIAEPVSVIGTGGTPAGYAPAGSKATGVQAERDHILTLCGLAILAVAALGFGLDVGLVAITVAVILALLSPESQKGAVDKVSWSTVLLVCGVTTYVGVMQEGGAIDFAGNSVAGIGSPLLAALLLCYIGGIVSAFASTTGILGAIIPLAVPFLLQGNLSAIGVIAALGVASSVVDVSPFSTNGALLVANAQGIDKEVFYRRLLAYGSFVVVFGPMIAWFFLVVTGWF
ncbi:SLC13 family permease [Marinivivus vitaminiproducens]|uniref:SLC13 family permease n=1 Tax=Marinivivus vitaminiproducens TaxID=3035935 RepID=UPI00279F592C|nr:SLC13 family permease [Geminicoccaceae bacterium SCSIO 64248]